MRIPLTKYGLPQVVIFPFIVIAVMLGCIAGEKFLPLWVIIAVETLLAAVLIWVLSFFRDPYCSVPQDKNLLLAPADGRITDIAVVEEKDFIGGPALRIGIFLSIFDVHINRSPCNAKIEKIIYKKGRFKDARNPQAGRVNESNDLWIVRTDAPKDRLIVRQISGAIARRIVCSVSAGQELSGGRQFGMIKFGSRTELYLPAGESAKCIVKIDDKVKAGLTPLVKYE